MIPHPHPNPQPCRCTTFLDVDDLDDLRKIEKHVARSELVLIVLTAGMA
jgi:hypothetical protein